MKLIAVCVALAATIASAFVARAADLDPGFVDTTPAPATVPPGLYLVTDVYAGSVTAVNGSTTTYTTVTVRATPGTYARVLEVVATGVASAYDGRSFNGRARLTDGRAVAGAYYETFVRVGSAFIPVNIVFFQDDSETRSVATPTIAPSPTPTMTASARPSALVTPAVAPTIAPPPSAPTAPRTLPPTPVAAAGVALASDGPTLAAIDVLRGRTVHLWPRAFVDGRPVTVRSWRLLSGGADTLSQSAGTGSESAAASWLSPAGSSLRFEVTTDAAPGRVLVASINVTVRSPALLR